MVTRVLHVLGGLNPGGIEVWLMQLLRGLPRTEFEIDFALQQETPGIFDDDARSLQSNLYRLGSWRNYRTFDRRLTALIKERSYSVIHSHGYLNSGVIMKVAARRKVPIRIAHSHNCIMRASFGRPIRRIYEGIMRRRIDRYSTRKIAISTDAAFSLFGPFWRNDPRTRVIYYGFDFSKFAYSEKDRHEVRETLGFATNDRVLVNIGSFYPQKNHSFLVDLAKNLVASDSSYKFLLIGDGPLRKEIENRVAELGLMRFFRFVGLRNDVHRLLSASDLFAFPSLFEGLGIAALEAQAAGIPCVVNSSLPMELTVNQSLVIRLPIEGNLSEWADRIQSDRFVRVPSHEAISKLNDSRFGLKNCLDQIRAVYLGEL